MNVHRWAVSIGNEIHIAKNASPVPCEDDGGKGRVIKIDSQP